MVYLDTNVLVYAGIEQDIARKDKALCLIRSLAEASELHPSALVLQELVFTMAKLRMDVNTIKTPRVTGKKLFAALKKAGSFHS